MDLSSRYEIGLWKRGIAALKTLDTSLVRNQPELISRNSRKLTPSQLAQFPDDNYEQVQAHVNGKYDAWQRDILSRFGVKLGNAMKEMHASILKARNDLEHQLIEASSVAHDGSESSLCASLSFRSLH